MYFVSWTTPINGEICFHVFIEQVHSILDCCLLKSKWSDEFPILNLCRGRLGKNTWLLRNPFPIKLFFSLQWSEHFMPRHCQSHDEYWWWKLSGMWQICVLSSLNATNDLLPQQTFVLLFNEHWVLVHHFYLVSWKFGVGLEVYSMLPSIHNYEE